jgi:hypothetical protein
MQARVIRARSPLVPLIFGCLLAGALVYITGGRVGSPWKTDISALGHWATTLTEPLATAAPTREAVRCSTTKGVIHFVLNEREAPRSVATLKAMVASGWMADVAFWRVNDVATQFGVRYKDVKFPVRSDWQRDLHPEPNRTLRKPWVRGDVSMIGGAHMFIGAAARAHGALRAAA